MTELKTGYMGGGLFRQGTARIQFSRVAAAGAFRLYSGSF